MVPVAAFAVVGLTFGAVAGVVIGDHYPHSTSAEAAVVWALHQIIDLRSCLFVDLPSAADEYLPQSPTQQPELAVASA